MIYFFIRVTSEEEKREKGLTHRMKKKRPRLQEAIQRLIIDKVKSD